MSVFSLKNVLVTEQSVTNTMSYDLNKIATPKESENYSFMPETYRFLESYNREYNNTLKTFYRNILESNNSQELITESFDSFFDKVHEIIKKFIEFIKKIFAKFVTKMHQLFKSESYLKKHEKEFSKFTNDDKFTIHGYKFTCLNDIDIPYSAAVDIFGSGQLAGLTYKGDLNLTDSKVDITSTADSQESYSDITGDDEDAKDKRQTIEKRAIDAIDKQYDELVDNLDDFYDQFRGKLIKVSYDIDSSDWEKELHAKFRDDQNEPIDIDIEYTDLNQALHRFKNYNDTVRSIEKTRNEIEKDYNKLEKALESAFKTERKTTSFKFNTSHSNVYAQRNIQAIGGTTNIDRVSTTEINNKIDSYMRAKVGQVQEMSSIHTMAFSAKLTAAKDCFVQDKSILYKALTKIQSHKNK